MPVNNGLDAAQAKRNRLPFKPPRRQSTGIEGSSKTTSSKKISSSTASTSKTKSVRKPTTTSTIEARTTKSRKRKAQSLSSGSEPASDDDDGNESNLVRNNDDESPSTSRSGSPLEEPDYILAEIVTNDRPRDIESGEPGIPPKLLTRLLHHHFQNPKTKIAKDANDVVAKYIDIFVREALARAAYERAEGNAANGDGAGRSVMDGFLEVEDLEKLAPQMILDF